MSEEEKILRQYDKSLSNKCKGPQMLTACAYLCLLVVYVETALEYRLNENASFTYENTPDDVMHLDADKFIPGNLIFSDRFAIRTTDGNAMSTIAGSDSLCGYEEGIGTSARFNHITSFVQVFAATVILVDKRNGCLRSLNRHTTETSRFAGICDSRTYHPIDGEEQTFSLPKTIIVNQKIDNQLLVGDYCSLRSVTFIGKPIIKTIFDNMFKIVELIQDHMSGHIYILGYECLVRYDQAKEKSVTLAGVDGYYLQDLTLLTERILMYDMVILYDNVLLVSALGIGKLILIDLNLNMTFKISGKVQCSGGFLSYCERSHPESLAVIGRTLYIEDYINEDILAVTVGEGESLFQLWDNDSLLGKNTEDMTYSTLHHVLDVSEVEINNTTVNVTAQFSIQNDEETDLSNKVTDLTDLEIVLISCVAVLTIFVLSLFAVMVLKTGSSRCMMERSAESARKAIVRQPCDECVTVMPLQELTVEVKQHSQNDLSLQADADFNALVAEESSEYGTLRPENSQDMHIYSALNLN